MTLKTFQTSNASGLVRGLGVWAGLRGEPITASPKVVAIISDSLKLARMVLQRLNAEPQ